MRNCLITIRLLSFFSLLGTLWAFDELDFGSDTTLADKAIVSFDGYIFESSENLPISGVAISGVTESQNVVDITISDKEGFFKIEKAAVLKWPDVLRFEHPKYVTTTKVLRSDSKLIIWMKERGRKTVFHSTKETFITLEKGGYLNIPSSAFSIQGRPYYGRVEMTASYIDVTDRNEVRAAPGRYLAWDEGTNQLVPLTSFGMIEITAALPWGNMLLELIRPISVAFPILAEDIQDRVNLYEFNVEKGVWILEGRLQNVNNTFLQGEITSVNTAWNADQPCSETLVCVKVKVTFGSQVCGVGATGMTYQGFDGIHMTGPDDYVELMVCPDSNFKLGACWILCCGPGVPLSDPCCNNPQYSTIIDMNTYTLNPAECTDIGTWAVHN